MKRLALLLLMGLTPGLANAMNLNAGVVEINAQSGFEFSNQRVKPDNSSTRETDSRNIGAGITYYVSKNIGVGLLISDFSYKESTTTDHSKYDRRLLGPSIQFNHSFDEHLNGKFTAGLVTGESNYENTSVSKLKGKDFGWLASIGLSRFLSDKVSIDGKLTHYDFETSYSGAANYDEKTKITSFIIGISIYLQ